MNTKRAIVPEQTFNKRPTALDKLTGKANFEGETTENKDGNTVSQLNGNTVKSGEKTSFYLRSEQLDKLDELTIAYKKRTGKRINRNDIIRTLVDDCSLETLLTSMTDE